MSKKQLNEFSNISKKVAKVLASKGIRTDAQKTNSQGDVVVWFFDDRDMAKAEILLKKQRYKIYDKDTGFRNKRFTVTNKFDPENKLYQVKVEWRLSSEKANKAKWKVVELGIKADSPKHAKKLAKNYMSKLSKKSEYRGIALNDLRVGASSIPYSKSVFKNYDSDKILEIAVDKQGFRKYEKNDDSDFEEPRKGEPSSYKKLTAEMFGIPKLSKKQLTEAPENWKERGEVLLATNTSYWQWEYDSHTEAAYVFVNTKNRALRLVIEHIRKKTGLGAGTNRGMDEWKIGTLDKPVLGKVKSYLKKYSMSRSRASSPFKMKWTDAKTNSLDSLSNIIKRAK